ncbi:hypothetical protein [Saccharolobus shibatae]|uniref:Uncharacterized protein n=1 Tax=Saccharolobus shibatae TaxID=2286 RepID=A0A8F5BYL1_9CREN|nr:hypothetical protein [Saccharolobus shibatae]QXJ30817.1 hypothetical protein J5U21_00466 [Saccharolobus shibatae]QXJ33852.1 hypothetical protein J5U22_00397 [Saccharolobus shibatae]
MGVKGAESLAKEMDGPLIKLKYFFGGIFLSDANDAPPQLDRGLNGTVGGAASISFL